MAKTTRKDKRRLRSLHSLNRKGEGGSSPRTHPHRIWPREGYCLMPAQRRGWRRQPERTRGASRHETPSYLRSPSSIRECDRNVDETLAYEPPVLPSPIGRILRLPDRPRSCERTCVAVARELAGFIWAIGLQAQHEN